MNLNTLTPVARPVTSHSTARLCIHAENATVRKGESQLDRLRALYSSGQAHNERTPLHLKNEDMKGCEWLSLEDAGTQVDVLLPSGNYHVTAQLGSLRRGYTMTLCQDSSFDLHLSFKASRH